MKVPILIPLIAASSFAILACDNSKDESSHLEERIKELESGKQDDLTRQRELEQELSSHKLAMEWAAIERERKQIEDRRAELEKVGGDSDELQSLEVRDENLAGREALAQEQHAKLVVDRQRIPSATKLPANAEFPMAGLKAGDFAAPSSAANVTIDYQYFNDALSPYGTWYDTEEYGSVWQPAACREPDWRPYTRGQWSCSDRGWVWISSEPFGWATYHYGRWARLQKRGWIWVPGTEWAPNWCTWRSSDSFIGWAPLPPETLAYQNCSWDARVEKQYGIASSCFSFIRTINFDRSISHFCLPVILNENCLAKTTNITRIKIHKGLVFCGGPGYHELTKRLGRRIPFYEIHRHSRSYAHHNPANLRSRIQGSRLIVAAPTVQKSRPHRSLKRLPLVAVERSKSIDPQVLEFYRKMRQREARPATIINTPTGTSPVKISSPQATRTSRANKPVAQIRPTPRPVISSSKSRTVPIPSSSRTPERQKSEARLQAFREMARNQRALASAERARREEQEAEERAQREALAQQQRIAQEAERQKIAAQQIQREQLQKRQDEEAQRSLREEMQRRSQEEAQRKQRDEQQRITRQRQQQQEEARRRQQVEDQRRQQAEAQRRARDEAQRRQRLEQDRQRAAEQRRQQEQAQRQQREEQQRRSQERAQRQKRDDQQRQRQAPQRRQRGK